MAETDAGVIYAAAALCLIVASMLIGMAIHDARHTRQKIREAQNLEADRQIAALAASFQQARKHHKPRKHIARKAYELRHRALRQELKA